MDDGKVYHKPKYNKNNWLKTVSKDDTGGVKSQNL